jgi:hypothetical protein
MAELADAADSKSAGLRPLGVRFPLPAPKSNPFREQLVNLWRNRQEVVLRISAHWFDSAQTLPKLLLRRVLFLGRFCPAAEPKTGSISQSNISGRLPGVVSKSNLWISPALVEEQTSTPHRRCLPVRYGVPGPVRSGDSWQTEVPPRPRLPAGWEWSGSGRAKKSTRSGFPL